MKGISRRLAAQFGLLVLLIGTNSWISPVPALAHNLHVQSSAPSVVTIVGDLQNELGCTGDWDPTCATTNLVYDNNDDVWQNTWAVPTGIWQYKAAINNSWDENYGLNAVAGGANIPLTLDTATSVKFYFDDKSHWVTDNHSSIIATVAGNFQSEIGCSGDWDPSCLRSWLEDPDGDSIYSFETSDIPAGSYEAKVAINESWDENYGTGGAPGGANIHFVVNKPGIVTFSYDGTSHLLTITTPGHYPDNNVEWDGLRHDSRDLLYRTPGGAVPAGTEVKLRFRTFHNDVTSVKLRLWDINANSQKIDPMELIASDESCYQADLEIDTCDYWQISLASPDPDNLWYRFIITDGTKTVYYADDTSALDGGLGTPSEDIVDSSYALMFFDPEFTTPEWTKQAVIYQIFPDRFRNGRANNDPKTGDSRYNQPVLSLPWGTLPEGYCRNYTDANDSTCPWRFDSSQAGIEQPLGRDYMGGDLKGVDQNLDYLYALGINTIYFNPIFDSASNHGYDTQDYYKIDPYFGTQKDWENLVKHANQLGIRIILDGVFNHMSSDSPFFDRYHHFNTIGACESLESPYRDWFTFHDVSDGTGTCVDSMGNNNSATYDGWFGFDSIPVLNKSNPDVLNYFVTNPDSISTTWLNAGASGWRLDVMGDSSFPDGYWENFRSVVKETNPQAAIIGELWQKDSTLLRFLRGDRADTTMNYRLRDAVLAFLASQNFDSKGFADSGHPIPPSVFASRIESIREDYPDASYYSLMNLLDSHDTERLRWTLTPGPATIANKEQGANVDEGKIRQKLASLIQFTVPGAPTIYYGDEVGMTGDTDPDDRRTYPWEDKGGITDPLMLQHYQTLAQLHSSTSSLASGDLKVLLADDVNQTVAYGRKTGNQVSIIAINKSNDGLSLEIPVGGYIPDGITLEGKYGVNVNSEVSTVSSDSTVQIDLSPLSGLLLVSDKIDLTPLDPPTGVVASEGDGRVNLVWEAVPGAVGYNVYRSPVSGGGYVKVNSAPVNETSLTETDLLNARLYYFTIRSLDTAGNESVPSIEVTAMPHLVIGWANLQWPPTISHVISAIDPTDNAYGQVWIDGATNQVGLTPTLQAQLGFGPEGTNPASNNEWTWINAVFNVDAGNNDEFMANMLPEKVAIYDYLYRYTTTNGRDWVYADLNGPIPLGTIPSNPGKLTVNPSSDTTPPQTPTSLKIVDTAPDKIDLTWNPIVGDATLYGYEVLRSDISDGPFTLIARVTGTTYPDVTVIQDQTYYYEVQALDTSFNRSAPSDWVEATAESRTVTVVFNVTVPDTTETTGRSVHIAGTLSLLDGGLPDWNPGSAVMNQVDATHWTITLTGKETTQLQYKYALGDWEHVEKDAVCGEIGNRMLTLSFGTNGTQMVNDTVLNWRNVAPCGN